MSATSIYAYAWDLAEDGLDEVVPRLRDLGIGRIAMAASYHAGKFLRPHGKRGKVYFPEDGTVYFRPDPGRYGRLKPLANSMLAECDMLAELCARGDIEAQAWTVLMHNSRLGAEHPEACVHNAFGDRYIYNLCPASPDARAYAVALAGDLSDRFDLAAISLETPGYLPYTHGYHHEFAMVRLNGWVNRLLGLCFCDHCLKGAAKAGIDATTLRQQVADDIGAALASPGSIPDDMAEAAWLADVVSDGRLRAFLQWRCDTVTSLVGDIREVVRKSVNLAVVPSVVRPTAHCWYEGSDIAALAKVADTIEACLYEPSAARVTADLRDIGRRMKGEGCVRALLRPGYPDFEDRDAFLAAVRAARNEGVDGLGFYNYGHLPAAHLDWIGDATNESRSMRS
ncbi:MAG: hypothetical protein H6851_09945 [Geminicoccaceae bacterium]|nr:hypothetical protein [Geminicoccaceae bacterium]